MVKVRLDVTKRLVRGKKITIEGREGKWVNFKYERLLNFYYRCGLLSHALKNCPKIGECNKLGENGEFQYGAWLRGEIIWKSGHDSTKSGMERGVGNRQWGTGAESEQRSELVPARGALKEVGKDHVLVLTNMENSSLTRREPNVGASKQQPTNLQKNGKVKGLVRKQEEKEVVLGEKALDQPKIQSRAPKNMQWEKATSHEGVPNFKIVMAPSLGTNNLEGSPPLSDAKLCPLAMSYDLRNGWTAEQLGLKSRHWKRLARKAKANLNLEGKSPTWQKRSETKKRRKVEQPNPR